jgi:hypothetical protein
VGDRGGGDHDRRVQKKVNDHSPDQIRGQVPQNVGLVECELAKWVQPSRVEALEPRIEVGVSIPSTTALLCSTCSIFELEKTYWRL